MARRWISRALPLILVLAFLLLSFVSADQDEALVLRDEGGGMERLVLPGRVAFLPQRWLPSSPDLHRLYLRGRHLHATHTYLLAQHEMLGLDPSFAVRLVLNYRYSIDPAGIATVLQQTERPDSSGISDFLKIRLTDFWYSAFRERLQADERLVALEGRAEQYIRGPLVDDLNRILAADGIRIESVFIEDIVVPDAARYRAVLANGQNLIEERLKRLRLLEEARARREAEEILLSGKRKHLAELGKLLGRYPALREYMAIDGLQEHVKVFVMPYDRFTGQPSLPDGDTGLHRFDYGELPSTGGFRDRTPP